MKRLCLGGGVAVALMLVLSSISSAATIQEVLGQTLADPTHWYDYGYNGTLFSSGKAWLSEGQVGADGRTLEPGSRPTSTYATATGGAAVSGLLFEAVDGGGGGGGGGSSDPDKPVQTTFKLSNDNGGTWEMDFSMLFYDAGFTGEKVTVELIGDQTGSEYRTKDILAADIQAGYMLTWHIDAAAGETVIARTTAYGGETFASGFFATNPTFNVGVIPEPATMGLLALGAAGAILRRRRSSK